MFNRIEEEIKKGVTHIDLVNQGLFDDDIEKLYEFFKKTSNQVTSIDLTRNMIGVKGAELLACLPLKKLNLAQNELGDEGIRYFYEFNINSPLEFLDVRSNDLTEEGAKKLLEFKKKKNIAQKNIIIKASDPQVDESTIRALKSEMLFQNNSQSKNHALLWNNLSPNTATDKNSSLGKIKNYIK